MCDLFDQSALFLRIYFPFTRYARLDYSKDWMCHGAYSPVLSGVFKIKDTCIFFPSIRYAPPREGHFVTWLPFSFCHLISVVLRAGRHIASGRT